MKTLLQQPVMRPIKQSLRQGRDRAIEDFYHLLARSLKTASNEHNAYTYLFETEEFTPETFLKGYTLGMFPSAYYGDGRVTWHQPDPRGILPINDLKIPRNLHPLLRRQEFEMRADDDLLGVLEGCAEYREKTHITQAYMDLYMQLFDMGIAHCVTVWQDDKLVGGTYGIGIGAYFASESSFFRVKHAGKIAIIRLAEILFESNYVLHDIWWPSAHLEQLGSTSISNEDFQKLHIRAVIGSAKFDPDARQTVSLGDTYQLEGNPV